VSGGAVRLIHWNAAESVERAERLRAAGYKVVSDVPSAGGSFRRELQDHPPIAVVIDLSRLPMQGRDVAFGIRQLKALRTVPIVFVDGEPEKVARVRQALPDATYARWDGIGEGLAQAIAQPRPEPQGPPPSVFAGYAGTPLLKKLGVRPESRVALVGAPDGFRELVACATEGALGSSELILWFVRSRSELERGMRKMAGRVGAGSMWILWPKKTSKVSSDLTQQIVRATAMAAGLVDYKICSVDDTWSALRFTRRK
jgi:CheY-like chemotaxis protein